MQQDIGIQAKDTSAVLSCVPRILFWAPGMCLKAQLVFDVPGLTSLVIDSSLLAPTVPI